jgi:hypothetical protein
VAEKFFHVFCEVWIEDRGPAGFFFVRFGQGDALGDAAPRRFGGMKDRYGPLAIFDDDKKPPGEGGRIALFAAHGSRATSHGPPHSVRNRKCQVASTNACTIADAKRDPVFRHVHP